METKNSVIDTVEQADIADRLGEGGFVMFTAGKGADGQVPASLKLMPNGDIFVNEKLAASDLEVVNGFRRWLKEARMIRTESLQQCRQLIVDAMAEALAVEFTHRHAVQLAEQLADIVLKKWGEIVVK